MADQVRKAFDEYVVLLAQGGDREAFAKLAERWRPRHFAHARRLLGNHDAAADAVQEAWVGIVLGLRRLKRPELFPAWSFSIVTRRCQDRMRRNGRSPPMDPDADPAAPDSDAGEAADLRRALASLPPDQRAVVALFYLEGLTIPELAAAVNAPAGTVKSRLFHARRALRRFFDVEGVSDEPDR